jgi:hypothetical protein
VDQDVPVGDFYGAVQTVGVADGYDFHGECHTYVRK